jgi:putative endonuclease
MTAGQELGRWGEECAATWYRAAGFDVVDRNWRVREGELDLVCRRDKLVVFSEVKTRSSTRFGSGVEAVGIKKQRRIRRLATQWLQDADDHFDELRFDVVDVDRRGTVQVWQAAF